MRDPYLLAASLLTVLAIPASALPQMSIILPENWRFNWDLQQGSQQTITNKTIPNVDISLPKFTSQALQPLQVSPPVVGAKIIPDLELAVSKATNQDLPTSVEPSINSTPQESNRTLVSGSQLYDQRVAALKTGQINQRLFQDSLESLESAKKRQLTYEDWKRLLALEAKAIAQNKAANHLGILVGDSLSMWFPQEKLPVGKMWLNQGISGDTSTGVLKRLAAFSETRPDVIYLMAGINDLRKGASDEVILRNHRRIMRNLRQNHPNAQIIVQSILPTRLPTISNQRIRHLNTQLALIAKQEKVSYINMYKWFTDFEGNLRPELTTDGLHLSPEGYEVWGAALEDIELKLTQRQK